MTKKKPVPSRYLEPVHKTYDKVMPNEFAGRMGEWLYHKRSQFERGGDDLGKHRFNYELCEVDKVCDFLEGLKKKLVEKLPEALRACDIEAFDLRFIEMHATLYHHGSHFCWHDDAPGYDGEFVASRRITFCYYMHTEPKMFEGGELEFLDGTLIEPKNNRLVFFHPLQQHRIRQVECWSSQVLHGRWALFGWLHGDAPEGYAEPAIRGTP